MWLSDLLLADERLPPEASPTRAGGPAVVRRYVGAEGTRVSYLAAEPEGSGPSPALLLIHGAGVSARSWTCQLRGLSPALHVLAVDLPGHGESDPVADVAAEFYADTVRGLLDVLEARPVFVAGHSLGGGVALALAARHPEVVRGLVLVSSCAKLPESTETVERLFWYLPGPIRRLLVHWMATTFWFLPGPLRKALFFATAKKLLFMPGASADAIRVGIEEVRACRPETILKDVAAARAMNLEAMAQGLRAPTLILCGREDRLTPPSLSQRLNELIPGSRLVLVEGAGHMLPLEAPEQVNRAVLAFVESVVAGTLVRDAAAGATKGRSVLRRLLGWLKSPFRPRRP